MRKLLFFVVSFSVVLGAGAAFAQTGAARGFGWGLIDGNATTTTVAKDFEPVALAEEVEKPEVEVEQPEKTPAADEPVQDEKPADGPAPDEKPVFSDDEPETKADVVEHDKDVTPPELVILRPANNSVVEHERIEFSGETEPGARVSAGDWKAEVDAEGHWSIVLTLRPGKNLATFTAKDAAGNESTASVAVTYEPVRDEPKEHRFTARQKLEANPDGWNVYSGTGTPGAPVTVRSEFGGGETEVRESGEWIMEVHFDAPANTPFRVTASSQEQSVTFSFTVTKREYEFTAHQKYGSCAEEVPFDVFYGTGRPGTAVEVDSLYGGGRTEINDKGHWELRVEFPEAPAGATFGVGVWNEGGHEEFPFTVANG
ncbi:MAG: hypothetical protein OEO77_14125 [Acidimicrobiia bacterium]|nr:hypothetical protein [Acidimicrobiia bacterium]